MKIIIDYNNDELVLEQGHESTSISLKKVSPSQLRHILEEIFNRIENFTGVSLHVIDEDTRRTVNEW